MSTINIKYDHGNKKLLLCLVTNTLFVGRGLFINVICKESSFAYHYAILFSITAPKTF